MKTNVIELNVYTDADVVRSALTMLDNGSALTMEGLSEDSINTMADWFDKEGYLKDGRLEVYKISGALMDSYYDLKGDNCYQDDVTIVAMEHKNFTDKVVSDVPTILEMKQMGFRWFDDIVANNNRRNALN